MPSSRAASRRRPGTGAVEFSDPTPTPTPTPVPSPPAPAPAPAPEEDPRSIINSGDCRLMIRVNIFEHRADGVVVHLPLKNPRVVVEVDVDIHLHDCKG